MVNISLHVYHVVCFFSMDHVPIRDALRSRDTEVDMRRFVVGLDGAFLGRVDIAQELADPPICPVWAHTTAFLLPSCGEDGTCESLLGELIDPRE